MGAGHDTSLGNWRESRRQRVNQGRSPEDLSPEQTTQLKEIHKKYHDQIAQLEAKEKQESLALLNDKQKQEVEAIEAKRKAEMEQHRAAATTRPSSPTTKP
jgi:F0F1-type ATP synthase membrane subunit b/b'